MQYNEILCNTMKYYAIQLNKNNIMQYNTTLYTAVQYTTIHYIIQYNKLQTI